jgi:hypothetical protein
VPAPTERALPGIPQPHPELDNLVMVASALKQAVEVLGGSRGDRLARAATFLDLIDLGLVSVMQVQGMRSDWRGARVDFVSRREVEELRARVASLEASRAPPD